MASEQDINTESSLVKNVIIVKTIFTTSVISFLVGHKIVIKMHFLYYCLPIYFVAQSVQSLNSL